MPVSEDHLEFIKSQLSEFGNFETKGMFGGVGIFREGLMFAMIGGGTFRLKVDDHNKDAFEKMGMKPLYSAKKKQSMPYWEVPVEVLENSTELAKWAQESYAAALRAKKKIKHMKVINIKEKFGLFNDQWSPKIIGQLNGQDVKLAKLQGEFVWHDHKDEDELFYVVKGSLKIEFRDGVKTLNEGEMLVIPKGVEHKPIAEEEVWILLFEPSNIKHTGDVSHDITKEVFDKI